MSFKTVAFAAFIAVLAITTSAQFIPGQSYSIVSQLNQAATTIVALMNSLGPFITGLSTPPAVTVDIVRISTLLTSTLSLIVSTIPIILATTFSQGIAGAVSGAVNAASYPGMGGAGLPQIPIGK